MFSFQTTRILPLHTLMSSPFRFYSLLAGRGGGKGPETSPCPEQGLQAPLGRGRCCSQNVLSQHVWDIFGIHSPPLQVISGSPPPHTPSQPRASMAEGGVGAALQEAPNPQRRWVVGKGPREALGWWPCCAEGPPSRASGFSPPPTVGEVSVVLP